MATYRVEELKPLCMRSIVTDHRKVRLVERVSLIHNEDTVGQTIVLLARAEKAGGQV
jgi:hypothetical protein